MIRKKCTHAIKFFFPHIMKDNTALFRIALSLALMALDAILALSVPYAFKLAVDKAGTHLLPSFLALYAVLWTLERCLSKLQSLVFFPVISNCIRDTTYQIIEHLHRSPIEILGPQPRIVSAIKRMGYSARKFLRTTLLHMPVALIKYITGTLSFVLFMGPGSFIQQVFFLLGFGTLFVLYTKIVISIITWYCSARTKSWAATDSVAVALRDQILNTRTIRFDREEKMEILNKLLTQESDLWITTTRRMNVAVIVITTTIGGIFLTSLLAATWLTPSAMTAGHLVMLKGLLLAACTPLISLSNKARSVAESISDINFVTSLIEQATKPKTTPSQSNTKLPSGFVCDKITFGYGETPILKDVSLAIAEGETVFLKGESGVGKSSLAHLLVGLQKPQHGTIYLRNKNVLSYTNHELRSIVRLIPQETYLMYETLRKNLLFGVPHHRHHLLDKAIEMVGLKYLSKSLDSNVGDLGNKFSGGERQRIHLANAILTRPQIIILDETMNALSNNQAKSVLKELRLHVETIIVITHHTTAFGISHRTLAIKNKMIQEIQKTTHPASSV